MDQNGASRPSVLVVQYQFLCRPLDDVNPKEYTEATMETSNNTQPLPDKFVVFCKGPNFLCSRYGQEQHSCVAERFESLVATSDFMNGIARQCYFVDRPVADMDNKLKRNLLYYWFATNFYYVKGSKNRQELPECLLCLVRMTYPNTRGNLYCQFQKYTKR